MLGWFVRILRALLVWKNRDVLRAETPINPIDSHCEALAGSRKLPPVPHEVSVAPALAIEQLTVPVFGLDQETPPLPAAEPLINSLAEAPKSFDNVRIETAEVEQNDSLFSPPPQAAISDDPAPMGADPIPASEAHDDVLWFEPPVESKPEDTLADASISTAPPAPQMIPNDDRPPAVSNEAVEPDPEAGQDVFQLPAPDNPTEPISNASTDADHELGSGAERASAPLERADDEPADGLPPSGIGQPRPLSRYRPRLRERAGAASRSSNSSLSGNGGTGPLDADLMLMFQPGGWDFTLLLLLRRADGMPEETTVRVDGDAIQTLAIDQAYFEPLPLSGIASALQNGISIETVGEPRRHWVRTGRPLHMFSERPGIPGFASVPRAVIGQENVILCTGELGPAVLTFCEATDADALAEVVRSGVADGWRCFRGFGPGIQRK